MCHFKISGAGLIFAGIHTLMFVVIQSNQLC
jgi:hypothetical protein